MASTVSRSVRFPLNQRWNISELDRKVMVQATEAAGFGDRISEAVRAKKTPLVVGLDPRMEQIPSEIINSVDQSAAGQADAYLRFCKSIVDVVASSVPAVKPQAAFFEQLGPRGMLALADTIDYASAAGLLVIMDAKRGDIGSTANAYAKAFLGPKPQSSWGSDALTVNPYLGDDSLEPFVDQATSTHSGIYVLVKTSNPGSQTFQERKDSDGRPFYVTVADHVQSLAVATAGTSGYGNVGAVVGATYPAQLAELREQMPNAPLLIPGFGAQGGTAADVAAGFDDRGLGAFVNSSRGIIFAYQRPEFESAANWQLAVEQATQLAIDQLATDTAAGALRNH